MRTIRLAAAAALLAGPALAQPAAAPLNLRLVCQGVRVTTEEETTSVTVSKDNDYSQRASGQATTTHLVRIPGQVDVEVADGQVRISPVAILRRSILYTPPKDGWYPLSEVVIDETQIAGRFRISALQKPRVRIDRRTGAITMEGFGMDYSGACEKSATPLNAQKF